MKFMILNEKTNPFMKRRELSVVVEHVAGATPSRQSLQQLLAKEWNVQPEQVDIKSIYTSIGRQSSRVKVFLWDEPKVQDISKQPKEEKKEEVSTQTAPASQEKSASN